MPQFVTSKSVHFVARIFSFVDGGDSSLHHDAAAELLLLCSQTQLLHVRAGAGDRVQPPHGWFGNGREGAHGGRVGLLLLQAGMRVRLLADVQTGLEEESSGGHGRQSGCVAGRDGRGATAAGGGEGRRGGGRGGGLRGLMPGAVLLSTHRGLLGGQGSGGVEHGRGRKHGSGRSRR